jgi:hypothetical protein
MHQAVQEGGGLITNALGEDIDAGELRGRERAKVGVIIHAENCHLVGYREACAEAGVDDLMSAVVMTGEDGDRRGQGF